MTTWVPGLCGLIVLLFTALGVLDPTFSRNNDQVIGGSLGFLLGLMLAASLYTVMWVLS